MRDFTLVSSKTKNVRMMRQEKLKGAYRQGDGYEAAMAALQGVGHRDVCHSACAGVSPEQALAKAAPDKLIQWFMSR